MQAQRQLETTTEVTCPSANAKHPIICYDIPGTGTLNIPECQYFQVNNARDASLYCLQTQFIEAPWRKESGRLGYDRRTAANESLRVGKICFLTHMTDDLLESRSFVNAALTIVRTTVYHSTSKALRSSESILM